MIAQKNYKKNGKNIIVNAPCFRVGLTLDCGQAFRWSKTDENTWHGVAFSTPLTLRETEHGVEFISVTEEEFEKIWVPYFDLERDYDALCERFRNDSQLEKAVSECYGIRLLRQEPWEALCSFIISQNNKCIIIFTF